MIIQCESCSRKFIVRDEDIPRRRKNGTMWLLFGYLASNACFSSKKKLKSKLV